MILIKFACGYCSTLTMKACRKLLEGDLGLPERSLADRKAFIQQYVDKARLHFTELLLCFCTRLRLTALYRPATEPASVRPQVYWQLPSADHSPQSNQAGQQAHVQQQAVIQDGSCSQEEKNRFSGCPTESSGQGPAKDQQDHRQGQANL